MGGEQHKIELISLLCIALDHVSNVSATEDSKYVWCDAEIMLVCL